MKNPFQKCSQPKFAESPSGFSLTEILTTVSIVGALSTIAIPTYLDQKESGCQDYPKTVISQAMNQAQAYNDEYGVLASGWSSLDKIGAIMTTSGPANGTSFNYIDLPGCGYKLKGSLTSNQYVFEATQAGAVIIDPNNGNVTIEPAKNKYNAAGCINVFTGASDLRTGDGVTPVNTADLSCS